MIINRPVVAFVEQGLIDNNIDGQTAAYNNDEAAMIGALMGMFGNMTESFQAFFVIGSENVGE